MLLPLVKASSKQERILAALFMVLANRHDWQMLLEVTSLSGSWKSTVASIATLLAGRDCSSPDAALRNT
ncbi:hypothetical protein ACCX84_10630 [Pantoea trifolii]